MEIDYPANPFPDISRKHSISQPPTAIALEREIPVMGLSRCMAGFMMDGWAMEFIPHILNENTVDFSVVAARGNEEYLYRVEISQAPSGVTINAGNPIPVAICANGAIVSQKIGCDGGAVAFDRLPR